MNELNVTIINVSIMNFQSYSILIKIGFSIIEIRVRKAQKIHFVIQECLSNYLFIQRKKSIQILIIP